MSQLQPDNQMLKLGFSYYAIDPRLQPYVQAIWAVDCDLNNCAPMCFRLAPDGCVSLVVNFAEPISFNSPSFGHTQITRTGVLSSGDNAFRLLFSKTVSAIGIRFKAGVCRHFLPAISEFIHAPLVDFDLSDLIPVASYQCLCEMESATKAAYIQQVMLRQLVRYQRQSSSLDVAIQMIQSQAAQSLNMKALAEQLGISARSLERQFNQNLGLSPKTYQKILRVVAAKEHIKSGHFSSLTEIAQDRGFYDQAHFNRDFKAVMHVTPGQYYREKKQRLSLLYNSD